MALKLRQKSAKNGAKMTPKKRLKWRQNFAKKRAKNGAKITVKKAQKIAQE